MIGEVAMKAMIRHRYGSPDVLRLEEVPIPIPGDDDVLIKVHAASVNAADLEILRADPLYVRLVGFGLFSPKIKILGSDVAGRIETVGRNVKRFQPGDEVFGDIFNLGLGGFAEYVSVPEHAVLVPKRSDLTFECAAAIPQAAAIALQGLRDKGQLQPGQKVLIVGAGGGAGSFAVQIAKWLGAEVTGVDSSGKLETMRRIGADHVIDYTRQDFTRDGLRYDLILDLVGRRSLFDHRRALAPGGTYVMAGGSTARIAQAGLLGPLISISRSTKMGILAMRPNREDLSFVANELIGTGAVEPVIDRRYGLSELPEALRYLEAGRAKGKLVITP